MALDSASRQIGTTFAGTDGGDLPAVSVYDAIRRRAIQFREKTAVIDLESASLHAEPKSATYGELHQSIVRAANLLLDLGLREGDRILYLAPNGLAGLTGFWTAQLIGVVVPVNPFLDLGAIDQIARTTGAKAVMSAGPSSACGSYSLGRALVSGNPELVAHLVLGEDAGDGTIDLLAASQSMPNVFRGREPNLDDIAAFFPTGGTTGAPKVARLSNRNLLVGAYSSAVASSLDAEHVVPLGLPMFHVGGGVIASTRTIMLGQTLAILTPAGFRTPELTANFWGLAQRFGFTQFISVPTVFSDLLATYSGGGTTIRHFTAGASKLPASLCRNYEKQFGRGIHEGYGMTETAGFCCVNQSDAPPRPGSGGTVAPFYRVKVVELDAQGRFIRECGTDETGNIAVAGPAVFQGYIDPAQDAEKFITGMDDGPWIDAGDLGRFDADGYLWITGREKDLIIRGGHNIDPAPIEEALLDHPDIVDAAAVGMPDARVGELPVAFVQIAEGASLDEAALRAYCLERLPERAGTPVRVFALEALPRTAMRKIFKPELRRLAAAAAVETKLGELSLPDDVEWLLISDSRGCLTVEFRCSFADPLLHGQIEDHIGALNLPVTFSETL
ncbi:AMP-binding protein [Novosphingobium sp. FGD1]|uniref:AMP-binding protein n=1 Tax=Novosphingobium silvae TaxID=2692619 RepID=A0A7X4GJD8_9SPHN|nr:AMP-binding protein [Novosphingobium silvae]MYL99733.1 AMP-binding protein [Novosphingobium silvae]